MIKIKRSFFITLCLIPLAALATGSRPAFGQAPSTGAGQATTQRGKPNRPGSPFKRPSSRPAEDPQEFGNALNFLERWSPNRFKAYESLDEDRKTIFRDRIVAFYRANLWMNRGDENDEMKKLREKLIRAEDEVFLIRWDILAAGGPRKANEEDRARLRGAVGEMVKIQIEERKLRLERLKENVKSEEEKLSAIEANPEQYVDQRYRDELEGRGLGLFDHPRRAGGGGPGGPKAPEGGQKGNEKPGK